MKMKKKKMVPSHMEAFIDSVKTEQDKEKNVRRYSITIPRKTAAIMKLAAGDKLRVIVEVLMRSEDSIKEV